MAEITITRSVELIKSPFMTLVIASPVPVSIAKLNLCTKINSETLAIASASAENLIQQSNLPNVAIMIVLASSRQRLANRVGATNAPITRVPPLIITKASN